MLVFGWSFILWPKLYLGGCSSKSSYFIGAVLAVMTFNHFRVFMDIKFSCLLNKCIYNQTLDIQFSYLSLKADSAT